MLVINKSRKEILSQHCKEAPSFSDKLLGMHKRSNLGGLMFKTRFGIQTFFLREPIDVVILGNGFNVVKVGTIKPDSLFFWNPKYSLVLEFPQELLIKL